MSESASGAAARIVVGADGSEGSKHALRWAARQAGLTGAALEVITAWDYPATFGWAPIPPEDYDLPGYAQKSLAAAIDEVFGSEAPASLRTRVVQGHAAEILVEASEGAELLVVGSRGYGGFADLLLGSVSTYCVHHAHGPVTVVRPD
jgi:nucleotide-binding universal stress UspA family protein